MTRECVSRHRNPPQPELLEHPVHPLHSQPDVACPSSGSSSTSGRGAHDNHSLVIHIGNTKANRCLRYLPLYNVLSYFCMLVSYSAVYWISSDIGEHLRHTSYEEDNDEKTQKTPQKVKL